MRIFKWSNFGRIEHACAKCGASMVRDVELCVVCERRAFINEIEPPEIEPEQSIYRTTWASAQNACSVAIDMCRELVLECNILDEAATFKSAARARAFERFSALLRDHSNRVSTLLQ